MAPLPSEILFTVPHTLKAQYCLSCALSLLYTTLAVCSFIYVESKQWVSIPLLLSISHLPCTWTLYRSINKRIHAGVALRVTTAFAVICAILSIVIFTKLGQDLPLFKVEWITRDNTLYFTSIVVGFIITLFPALTFIFSFVGDIKNFLYLLTLHDGEIE